MDEEQKWGATLEGPSDKPCEWSPQETSVLDKIKDTGPIQNQESNVLQLH